MGFALAKGLIRGLVSRYPDPSPATTTTRNGDENGVFSVMHSSISIPNENVSESGVTNPCL